MINYAMRIIFILLFCLTSSIVCFSQGYVIDNYHVDMDILSDSRVKVEERIDVDFEEARRGIIRMIPLNYKNTSIQEGSAILIDEIKVIGDPFLEIRDGNVIKIRIGSPDIKLSGKKSYRIQYTVLGAIEQFNNAAEFSWNIIGDQWDTKIEHASATIHFPSPILDKQNDILLYKNNRPLSLDEIEHELDDEKLSINFPAALKSRQGISVALRFKDHSFPVQHVPAAVLSDGFYISSVDMELTIDKGGEVHVSETSRMIPTKKIDRVKRLLPVEKQLSDTWNAVYRKPDMAVATWNGKPAKVSAARTTNEYVYDVDLGSIDVGRAGILKINYLIHGALAYSEEVVAGIFDLGSFNGQVAVDTIQVNYQLPEGVKMKKNIGITGFISQKLDDQTYRFIRQKFMTGPLHHRVEFEGFNPLKLEYPKESLYNNLLVESLKLNIQEIANGQVKVEQSILLKNALPQNRTTYYLGKDIQSGSFPYEIHDNQLLSERVHLPVSADEVHSDYRLTEYGQYNLAVSNEPEDESRFHANYSMPVLRAEGGMVVPIYFVTDAPVDHLQVEFTNVNGDLIADYDQVNYFVGTDTKNMDLISHQGYRYIFIPIKEGSLNSGSLLTRIKNGLASNWQLFSSLILAGLFYLLWYVFGRDLHYDGSSHPHPPDYMTPAEAGYLWDGKLHGRDLISLIYHWAAKDLIAIEEVVQNQEDNQYYLEKLKELPQDAFEYERVLFNKIFAQSTGKVKVSSLKNSLYKTMAEATKSLKREFEKKHLYEPLTRGFSTLFVLFGFLLFAGGLVLLGVGAGDGDFSWSLPVLIVAMSALFFGYYLPKKTALGSQYFIALQKFNTFIDDAPPEELAHLYENDSNYFQNTLAYAIVLGKAKKWAKRFSGLMTAPPSYYQGVHYDNFSPVLFTDQVITGMHSMEKDFYSTPAPAVDTSTYSGGRSSSFSGGGSSGGGGFGGGGGSSW
jgi:uncharacterized membrane protein